MELAATANDSVLPTEVLFDILLRLPIKTLLRLRLVCRAWRDLLTSNPVFASVPRTRPAGSSPPGSASCAGR